MHAFDDPARAQTTVAPVLSCGGGMVLDAAIGQCRTPRTESVPRSMHCPAGWKGIAGPGGSLMCQQRTESRVDTGRTRRVHSHTTYEDVWISTGTQRVQTGTRRVWVPPRTVVHPLVPPVRVQSGTKTVTSKVTMPGPPVRYQETVTRSRRVRRCGFVPGEGDRCRYETVYETHTRTVCCRPGPDIVQTITREVPVYGWQTTVTSTVPGRWDTEPVYAERETGYWHTVESVHYTTEPVYETVVEVQTRSPGYSVCAVGWQAAGSQCSRTVLGDPSAAPAQSCPSGSVPRYGDAVGGVGPSVLTCQASAPGSDTDTGTDQEDSGGGEDSPDTGTRPLHHLAGESDERLAELGIHRCANGLLSYVPCDDLPGRTWDSDPDVCDGIEGATYRPDHGGTCVTGSDVLNKCTKPGDCEDTTIRTYCPAIGELATTQIQEHAHPHRGAETYRVCVFDCTSFGTLPPYVQTRINGSYDYACLPADAPPESSTLPPTTTVAVTTATVTVPDDEEDKFIENGGGDRGGPPDDRVPRVTVPTVTAPITTITTTGPTVTAVKDPDDECALAPSATAAASALGGLRLVSHVRSADARRSPQRHFPGAGSYLQAAPGRGWAEVHGLVDVGDGDCQWTAAWVRVEWDEQRPWVASERRAMEEEASTRHLVRRWDAMSADHQQLERQWRRIVHAGAVCEVSDASGPEAAASCGWVLARPAAYRWQTGICFDPTPSSATSTPRPQRSGKPAADDPCWVSIVAGLDWIRSVGDYADGRVTVTLSGGRP